MSWNGKVQWFSWRRFLCNKLFFKTLTSFMSDCRFALFSMYLMNNGDSCVMELNCCDKPTSSSTLGLIKGSQSSSRLIHNISVSICCLDVFANNGTPLSTNCSAISIGVNISKPKGNNLIKEPSGIVVCISSNPNITFGFPTEFILNIG